MRSIIAADPPMQKDLNANSQMLRWDTSLHSRLLRPKPCGTARAPSLTWLIAARPPARQFKPHDALHSYAQQDTTQGHTAVLTTPCGHPGLLRSSGSPSAGSALPPAQLFQFLFWREVIIREGEKYENPTGSRPSDLIGLYRRWQPRKRRPQPAKRSSREGGGATGAPLRRGQP
jgi:hypothetical protein